MSRSEIVLDWICEQVRAGNIKPTEGVRLSRLVNMTDATDTAEEIKRQLESVNDFRYLTVGAKKDLRGISTRYDVDMMVRAISAKLQMTATPRPGILAWLAVALIRTEIFEQGMTRAQARRLLLSMDEERQKEWGSKSAFNDAFLNAQLDMTYEECRYFVLPILSTYNLLRGAKP